MLWGGRLDIENDCTLRLFIDPLDFSWPQATKLAGSRYPVAFPNIIAYRGVKSSDVKNHAKPSQKSILIRFSLKMTKNDLEPLFRPKYAVS
ncbi:hypothetical protein D8682_04900 [Buttiauxella sp. 3AFRM03]|nr:hypothetical protein D8682_04900 [Buttiauxella sp. 3AFRM03]